MGDLGVDVNNRGITSTGIAAKIVKLHPRQHSAEPEWISKDQNQATGQLLKERRFTECVIAQTIDACLLLVDFSKVLIQFAEGTLNILRPMVGTERNGHYNHDAVQ